MMKLRFVFFGLVLAVSLHASAGETAGDGERVDGDIPVANAVTNLDLADKAETEEPDESCSCFCSAQGILLLQCGEELENLGHFGNIKNCNLNKEQHPRCQ